jgi:hypothetical protein
MMITIYQRDRARCLVDFFLSMIDCVTRKHNALFCDASIDDATKSDGHYAFAYCLCL